MDNTKLVTAWRSLKDFWWKYSRNKAAVLGMIAVIILALTSLFAPLVLPYNPLKVGELPRFNPPSFAFLMGTDNLGRDIFAGVLYGVRVSLFLGLAAAAASALIGLTIGSLSGYYGGITDDMFMRVTEVFQTVPRFFFVILLVALWGPSQEGIIIAITLFSWPITARIVRAQFYSLKEKEFVVAARSLGEGDFHIIFREMVPNVLSSVVVSTSLQIASAIVIEAGLSFLGLGDPTVKSLGRMLAESQPYLRSAWWMMLFPGLAIFFTVLGFNLIGDGINDAFNPKTENI